MDRMMQIARQNPAVMLGLLSAAALAGAFVSQYGFGLKPCVLCLWQRWPHATVMLLAIIALAFRPAFMHRLVLVQVLALLVGAGIAVYHMGVEWRWWAGTAECTGDIVAKTVEELRRLLTGTKPARCDEPPFVFLGLSMAGWNLVYSLGSAALGIASVVTGGAVSAKSNLTRDA